MFRVGQVRAQQEQARRAQQAAQLAMEQARDMQAEAFRLQEEALRIKTEAINAIRASENRILESGAVMLADWLLRITGDAITQAAPSRDLIELIMAYGEYSAGQKAAEFVACVRKAETDLEFIQWLWRRLNMGQQETIPVVSGGICSALWVACEAQKNDVAKWIFTEFNLSETCSREFMESLLGYLRRNGAYEEISLWIWDQMGNSI